MPPSRVKFWTLEHWDKLLIWWSGRICTYIDPGCASRLISGLEARYKIEDIPYALYVCMCIYMYIYIYMANNNGGWPLPTVSGDAHAIEESKIWRAAIPAGFSDFELRDCCKQNPIPFNPIKYLKIPLNPIKAIGHHHDSHDFCHYINPMNIPAGYPIRAH